MNSTHATRLVCRDSGGFASPRAPDREIGGLPALRPLPLVEQALLLDLALDIRLLQGALPLEIELPLHCRVPRCLGLLLLTLLRLAIDRSVAGKTADRAADQHGARVVSECRATHTGAQRGTADGPDARTTGASFTSDEAEPAGGEKQYRPRSGKPDSMRLSHRESPSSPVTDATISSKDRASS